MLDPPTPNSTIKFPNKMNMYPIWDEFVRLWIKSPSTMTHPECIWLTYINGKTPPMTTAKIDSSINCALRIKSSSQKSSAARKGNFSNLGKVIIWPSMKSGKGKCSGLTAKTNGLRRKSPRKSLFSPDIISSSKMSTPPKEILEKSPI